MNIFTLGKVSLFLSSALGLNLVSSVPSYAFCEVNHISSVRSVQKSVIDNAESEQFLFQSVEGCDSSIITNVSTQLNLKSTIVGEDYQNHYYFNHNCDEKDSPFGISGIIIGDRINFDTHYSSIKDKPLLINSFGIFNVYSFGGTCVFSIYSF